MKIGDNIQQTYYQKKPLCLQIIITFIANKLSLTKSLDT